MAFPISAIGQAGAPNPIAPVRGEAGNPGGFLDALNSAIGSVEQSRQQAGAAITSLISGDGGELHNTALAVQRAELSFEMFVQVRNKVVQAYQEIMRMQV
jgi:flagellar hook-basal body complex protein FliE